MIDTSKEYILCSAISDPDQEDVAGDCLIFCGLRHHHILHQGKFVSRQPNHQGFLTSKGRFVSRTEAREIAISCGQVTETIRTKELDSSDLYK